MNNGLFKVNLSDVLRGAVVAVFAGAFLAVSAAVYQVGFDVFSADWLSIGKSAVNAGFYAFFGYMLKNFFSPKDTTLGMKFPQ